MLRRQVPALKLGVWGLGGYQTSMRCVREALAKRPQAFASGVTRAVKGVPCSCVPAAFRKRQAGGNCTGRRAPAAFRIRQAKGELHRTRVLGGIPGRSETVKLRGNAAAAFHVALRGVPNPSS